MAAMEAFNAPYSMKMLEIDNRGMFDTEVEEQGKVFVTTELGGAGTSTAKSVAVARKGARNLLIHAGILTGEPEMAETVMLDMPDGRCFTFSETNALLEPLVDLGDEVAEGQPIARLWPSDRSGQPAILAHAQLGGILTARHVPGLVKMGDCIGVVAQVV